MHHFSAEIIFQSDFGRLEVSAELSFSLSRKGIRQTCSTDRAYFYQDTPDAKCEPTRKVRIFGAT